MAFCALIRLVVLVVDVNRSSASKVNVLHLYFSFCRNGRT